MEYLIEKSTKEERKNIAKQALKMSVANEEDMPSEYAINLVKQYINGEKELEEIQKELIEKYKEQ